MIRVNEIEIDETAIVSEMQYHNAETHNQAKNMASEALVIAELLRQRAEKIGVAGSFAKATEKTTIEDDGCLEALLEAEVEIPCASEEDCRQYFESNPKKFMTTPLIAARHILLEAAPDDANARGEALDKGKKLIERLQENPELFSELATMHSRCDSAKTGGQLGQLGKGQTVPEFERQVFNCQPGLVGSPIESRYGVHIVVVDHRDEGRPLTYDMVKQRISDYLNERVRRKAIAQYIGTLISDAEIEGFDFSVSSSPLMQ